ncbi:MAG: hypothetical protein OEQ74_01625, partial [Gammaproteobacteria bacterium]|nr:hypothetical protein [Gammaproteobacteria bacterium]
AAAWLHLRRILLRARGRSELLWAQQMARMLQVSLLCFLVGGAALSSAYHDFILIILVISMNLDVLTAEKTVKISPQLSAVKSAL